MESSTVQFTGWFLLAFSLFAFFQEQKFKEAAGFYEPIVSKNFVTVSFSSTRYWMLSIHAFHRKYSSLGLQARNLNDATKGWWLTMWKLRGNMGEIPTNRELISPEHHGSVLRLRHVAVSGLQIRVGCEQLFRSCNGAIHNWNRQVTLTAMCLCFLANRRKSLSGSVRGSSMRMWDICHPNPFGG